MKWAFSFFSKIHQTVFSFFSGVCVSFAMNIFTGILMDASMSFDEVNACAIGLLMISSFLLMVESILSGNQHDMIDQLPIIEVSYEEIIHENVIKKIIIEQSICLVLTLFLIGISVGMLYCDFIR